MITLVLKGLRLTQSKRFKRLRTCLNDYPGSKGIETVYLQPFSPDVLSLNDYPGSKGIETVV